MAGAGGVRAVRTAQLAPPAGAALSATLENVLLALEPRGGMGAMHTTMMSASMTAYSTAVGPSSFLRNATSLRVNRFMGLVSVGSSERRKRETRGFRAIARQGCSRQVRAAGPAARRLSRRPSAQ